MSWGFLEHKIGPLQLFQNWISSLLRLEHFWTQDGVVLSPVRVPRPLGSSFTSPH